MFKGFGAACPPQVRLIGAAAHLEPYKIQVARSRELAPASRGHGISDPPPLQTGKLSHWKVGDFPGASEGT